jgi:hypothetical protein
MDTRERVDIVIAVLGVCIVNTLLYALIVNITPVELIHYIRNGTHIP